MEGIYREGERRAPLLLHAYREGEEPAGQIPGPSDPWRPIVFALVKNREDRSMVGGDLFDSDDGG